MFIYQSGLLDETKKVLAFIEAWLYYFSMGRNVIGCVLVYFIDGRNIQEIEISDENINHPPHREEKVYLRLAEGTGVKRKFSVAMSLLLGSLILASAVSFHWKAERDRTACYEMFNAARADFGKQATPTIDYYLKGQLETDQVDAVKQLENVYGLSFRGCKKVISG